jgi:hypothetical protein
MDDTMTEFDKILAFREELATRGVHKIGIYSNKKAAEMMEKRDYIYNFLKQWADADIDVFDKDEELNRTKLKEWTFDASTAAREIYDWHFMMAKNQMRWKEGKP